MVGLGRELLVCAILLLIVFIRSEAPTANVGDRSLLNLAGATAIMQGEAYPVVQRPPLYSMALAALGEILRIDPQPSRLLGQEFGNIQMLKVADDLLSARYLRGVLILHFALYGGAMVLLNLTMRRLAIAPGLRAASVFAFAMVAPLAPLNDVYDGVLTQFLLVLGLFAFAQAVSAELAPAWLVLFGFTNALAGLSFAVFQLLNPFLALLLCVPLGRRFGVKKAAIFCAVVAGAWMLTVGLWSVRNYRRHGFYGVSGVLGCSLSTRTALYLERISNQFPREAPAFLAIRNRLLVESPEHSGVFWGEYASEWLMRERGLSYVEANQFLTKVNTTAIRNAPFRYLFETGESLVEFVWPNVPKDRQLLKLSALAVESLLLAAFLWSAFLWVSYRILICAGVFSAAELPVNRELVCLLCVGLFSYSALITCGIDVGKPEQRACVEFLLPMVGGLMAQRLRSSGSSQPTGAFG